MEAPSKLIQPKDGEPIEFDDRFSEFCQQFANANPGETIPFKNIESWVIKLIKSFYEAHGWKKSPKCSEPLTSNDLKKEIGEVSFSILNGYETRENADKMAQLIEAAFEMGIEDFKDACMATAAIEFVFDDPEKGVEEYIKKHNLVITKEQEEKYGLEFQEMWDAATENAREQQKQKEQELQNQVQNDEEQKDN